MSETREQTIVDRSVIRDVASKIVYELATAWRGKSPGYMQCRVMQLEEMIQPLYDAALEEAATLAEQDDNRVPGWSIETRDKIASAIRARKGKR